MAIRDLLWGCPICGGASTLRTRKGDERCSKCLASFRRGRGAVIVATTVGGERIELLVRDWVDRLPVVGDSLDETVAGPARVRVRFAGRKEPLRTRTELLGWIERFDAPRSGRLVLDSDNLRFQADNDSVTEWRLEEITAVQPSSTSLQLKARGLPVASIRFLEDSVRFWEERIQSALRRAYAAAGKGEIIDFQPRIVVR